MGRCYAAAETHGSALSPELPVQPPTTAYPSGGTVTEPWAGGGLIERLLPIILRLLACLVPPRSLVLIRRVRIRGRGDAFMIIHPLSPPLVMAALDTHPLRSQHLALTLLTFTVCITTLFNGLFGVGGASRAGTFPRVSSMSGTSE